MNTSPRFKALSETVNAQPYNLTIATVCFLGGVTAVVTGEIPASIDDAITAPPLRIVWALYLLLGGLLTICGFATRSLNRPNAGYRIERLGQTILSFGFLVHSIALTMYTIQTNSNSYITPVIFLGLAFAANRRSAQILTDRAKIKAIVEDA